MLRFVPLAVLLVACGEQDLSLPDAASFSDARDEQDNVVVAVTHDGRVRHAGKDVTLDELAALLADENHHDVVLRVDGQTPWCHVQWVMSIIEEKAQSRVGFVVERGGRERVLYSYCVESDPWDFYMNVGGTGAKVSVRPREDGLFRVGTRGAATLRDVRRMIKDVAELAPPAAFSIEPRLKTPAIECLRVLNAFHELEEEAVVWGLAPPHPWVREQRRLPMPRRNFRLVHWMFFTDLTQKDISTVTLPVASMAAEDKADDPDDRLILHLDKNGEMPFKGRPNSLDEIATTLSESKRVYNMKRKATGRSGYEEAGDGGEWSRLFVLLRADKDVPWLHVKWILSLLEEERIFKLQFAVSKFANLSWDEEEAKALGADRRDEVPWIEKTLDCKLQAFLNTAPRGPEVVFVDVDADKDELRSVRASVEKRMKGAPAGSKVVGRIFAGDKTPLKRVVAFLNAFHEAGLEKVDFAGVEPAPTDVRILRKLPR